MLNIKMWLFIGIIVLSLLIGFYLARGYQKGYCVLCNKDNDIISKANKEGKLNQDNANILVSNLVNLGNVLDDGTFNLTEGNEDEYKRIFDALTLYDYKINYTSILAEGVS